MQKGAFKVEPYGNDDIRINVGGKQYSTQEISAFTLQKMKKLLKTILEKK